MGVTVHGGVSAVAATVAVVGMWAQCWDLIFQEKWEIWVCGCSLLIFKCWEIIQIFFKNKFILFIYFWLRWVFVAARGLSLVAASGGCSSLRCVGFSLRWLLLLRSTGSRRVGFSSCGMRFLKTYICRAVSTRQPPIWDLWWSLCWFDHLFWISLIKSMGLMPVHKVTLLKSLRAPLYQLSSIGGGGKGNIY